MAQERANHTLTKTALVNELSLKMLDDERVPTGSPARFLAYASTAMRRLLIDHARTRGRQRRGGGRQRLPLDEAIVACSERRHDLLALNEALESLAVVAPRRARIVEMIYFGGMTKTQAAVALDISLATVKRDWVVARAFLQLIQLSLGTLSDEDVNPASSLEQEFNEVLADEAGAAGNEIAHVSASGMKRIRPGRYRIVLPIVLGS